MSINVLMPQMGESILEGTLTKWLKKVGDKVRRDDSLFEVSTDKVDSEIPAPADGILSEIVIKDGATVKIGEVVAILQEVADVGSVPAAIELPVPEPVMKPERESSETPRKASVRDELAQAAEIPTTSLETETPSDVMMADSAKTPGEIGAVEPAGTVPATEDVGILPTQETLPLAASSGEPQRFIRTSPLVRRIARDYGVELSGIPGTGLSGRISKEDLFGYLERIGKKDIALAPGDPSSGCPAESALNESMSSRGQVRDVPAAVTSTLGELQQTAGQDAILTCTPTAESCPAEAAKFSDDDETVIMTPMRRAIAERMVLSMRTSAHVQTVFEVDMTAIVNLRAKHQIEFEARHGLKLTYTPFFVKALVETVRAFPILNCSVSGEEIHYRKPINVGIAVALETGLIVPVVKDAHLKSFAGLALAIHDLADRARNRKLKPEEVQSGTITITNPGAYGALFGTPIINQPQVAILDVGSLQKRPVIIQDAIAIRTMAYLVLSFDHRAIDGAVADQAMANLKTMLESWGDWRE